ncbi:MAG: phosphoribosylglycinamide formyltransferase [Propioniciclava sp.]
MTLRLVVLVSGAGTLLQALLDAVPPATAPWDVVAVGADRSGIEGLARAQRGNLPTFVTRVRDFPDRHAWDAALTEAVAEYRPDLVVSAGFMKLVGQTFLDAFGGRFLNTHPALLPSFPGAHGVRDALDYGVKVTGCTIFEVDSGIDTGRIIDQVPVRVEAGDDEETLHERIKIVERTLLLDTVTAYAAAR